MDGSAKKLFLCYNIAADSAWALNSAVECHLHTVEVIGSNPIAPTSNQLGVTAVTGSGMPVNVQLGDLMFADVGLCLEGQVQGFRPLLHSEWGSLLL